MIYYYFDECVTKTKTIESFHAEIICTVDTIMMRNNNLIIFGSYRNIDMLGDWKVLNR